MEIPVDVGYMVYFIMFYEGIGNLFPWNAFITASNYYGQRFCGTSFESNFENFFSITYTLSQTIGLALSVIYQNKLSLRSKIVYPLTWWAVVFAITSILVTIDDIDPNLLFWITLISACLCGSFGAILSGGLFGLGAMFPPAYTSALMNGQGVAGLTVAVSSMLTSLATSPIDDCSDDNAGDDGDCSQSIDFSALAYFIIATLILGSCVFAFLALNQFSFARYYIARADAGSTAIKNPDIVSPFIDVLSDDGSPDDAEAVPKRRISAEEAAPFAHLDDDGEVETTGALSYAKLSSVYSQIWIPSMTVFFVFVVTIAIFPSLIVLLESEKKCNSNERIFNDLYVPFFFFLFNFFDLIGRVSAGWITPLFTPKNVWIGAAVRVVFFFLFLFSNVGGSQLPVLFKSDAFPIIFMILMATSNGYVASLCMMMGASAVSVKDAPIAGTIMVFSLTIGLFGGACMSFLVVLISQGSL
eukprot:CAMPEP_0170400802 /NCGR_PEP_ID=MMETSP0117_2-20130122/24685_1 /TAXON_ID=400756 /ORGANISM="Durinskia baltica, Strain CSIRO CS-38" /LENGTH=470 /DNA_ID=CAMNT_0010657561 /DNA_START=133 /DNA_END=1545 /DNA_ORIENTATION=-